MKIFKRSGFFSHAKNKTLSQWLKQNHHIFAKSTVVLLGLSASAPLYKILYWHSISKWPQVLSSAYLSLTSPPPTSSLSTPPRPQRRLAAPRMRHARLHPRASACAASSSWSLLLREQQGCLLHLHGPASPRQEDAPTTFSNTGPLRHSLSPMVFYFTSLSRPDRGRQSLSVSLHWATRSRRAGTWFVLLSALSPEPRRVPGTR